MISFETERLICKSDLCVDDGNLVEYNQENTIDIFNVDETTGEEGDFVFYHKRLNLCFVCRITITDKRNCFEIVYDTKEEFWNQGYMTEALKSFCKWLFDNTNQEVIYALPEGICKNASKKVLDKCDFILTSKSDGLGWYKLRKDKK